MDAQAKQQIVERVKQAQNILVTVAANPTVDQLAACVGLTLLLNRMDKHATAVFSGAIPSTMEFLQPEKTIEKNTDSLRDFIISLDKNKADKLRYKVEDQVVRIFITPYRTSLSEKDLVFSQGDFNVEVVLALGVKDRNQIDTAITAHGRILHDATVVSVNAGQGNVPQIGQINWQDPQASSLSEMIVSISEAFGPGLIDNQMATAFLTGIVAETERFRNAKTTPKVMTMAAQLMAAGANQQLIATKLEPPAVPAPPAPKQTPPPPQQAPAAKKPDGKLAVSHEADKKDDPEVEVNPNEIRIDEQGNLKTTDDVKAEVEKLRKLRAKEGVPMPAPAPPPPPPVAKPSPPPPQTPPAPPAPEAPLPPVVGPVSQIAPEPTIISPTGYMPTLGPARTDILPSASPVPGVHHLLDPMTQQPAFAAPFTANSEPEWHNPYNAVSIDPLASQTGVEGVVGGHAHAVQPPGAPPPPAGGSAAPPIPAQPAPPPLPVAPPAPAPVQSGNVDSARSAVENALAQAPYNPALNPVTGLNAQPLDVDLHPEAPPPPPPAWQPPPPAPAAPPAGGVTPSLALPTNGAVSASTADLMAPPPPPPVPPPLPLASNPGAVVPTPPAPPQQQIPPPII